MKPQVKITESDAGYEFIVKSPRGVTKTFMVGKDGEFEWDQTFMLDWAGYRKCSLCQGTGKFAKWDQKQKLRFTSYCDCFQKQFFHIFPVKIAELIYNQLKTKIEKDSAQQQVAKNAVNSHQIVDAAATEVIPQLNP
jgi:hypothetical protein